MHKRPPSLTIYAPPSQWYIWGFSLAFSDTGGRFIGDLKYAALVGVLDGPSMGSARIPSIVFCVYQLMFAAITCVSTRDPDPRSASD
jgi:Amt family ammonium transporter